jgi:hypothetical protein
MADRLRVAIGLPDDLFTEEHLRLAKQLGCDEVVVA